MKELEIKNTIEIGYIADDLTRYSCDGNKIWVSAESLEPIFDFLCGKKPLIHEGKELWFGDVDSRGRKFWWRKYLKLESKNEIH